MSIDKRKLARVLVARWPCSARWPSSRRPRAPRPPTAATCSTTSPTARRLTPSLTAHGWTPRSYPGGPGVPGATWSPNNITFPTADGQKVMQLTASTDGTGAGTNHAELYSTQKRYLEGTYASRVRFTDTPVSGNDGDHINETFFTISPLNGDLDPTYSELDISEYLPERRLGRDRARSTTRPRWYTYRNEPWFADNVHSEQRSPA